ncbi:MAG TPA: YraN family protein [Candidatus Krumholzibacteria bacterium]|nr:YraN family protein [Candidatus Krumholzibacteria bacterium]
MNTRASGELGERIAAAFLILKGYRILDANVRVARREVDLVATDGHAIIAVEVKLRWGRRYGAAAEAIDERKLARLRVALSGIARELGDRGSPRIDVVTIDVDETGDRMAVEHYVGVT